MKDSIIEVDGHQVRELDFVDTNEEGFNNKRHVFIIGSKGIPASYGGYETFVECLTKYQKTSDIVYHIARLSRDSRKFEYNGARVFDVDIKTKGPQKAVLYDIEALKKAIKYCEERPAIKNPVFYILACRIGPFFKKYVKRVHNLGGVILVNPDGHEWKRTKWSKPIRKYWKVSEKLMIKHSDLLICDSKNIEKYIQDEYKTFKPNTTFISYGSNVTPSELDDKNSKYLNWLNSKGLKPNGYYLVVGRFVPENNYETMIREFMNSKTTKDFAIITTENDKFFKKLDMKLKFTHDTRIKFVGTVYDDQLLKKIRENAYGYFHGHEVGGTNPSLLEALGSTKLNLLIDVEFNREVAQNAALYWKKEEGNLSRLIDKADKMSVEDIEKMGENAKQRILTNYNWDSIVFSYESLFLTISKENLKKR